jgi:MFS superfamily sulfate permease-like transporter
VADPQRQSAVLHPSASFALRPSSDRKLIQTGPPLALQVLQWLPQYSLKKFAGDVIAALTMTSVIAPQAMSYATSLVHANPVSGLFGAAVPAMIYSVLGTCRQLSVGPEAALSLLTGDTVAKFLEEEEHAHGKMSEVDKAKFIAGVVTLITFQSGLVTFM